MQREYAAEIRTAAEMEPEVAAWRDLAKRAVEPNVFAEPELVLAGMQHLPEGRSVVLLLVWDGPTSTAGGGVLRGVFPLIMPRWTFVRYIRVWSPVSGAPGVPLVDRQAPAAGLETALAFLAARHTRFAGLVFPQVLADGPFAAALRSAAARTRRAIDPTGTDRRRVLVNAPDAPAAEGTRRKIATDLRLGRQKLASLGDVEIDHARTPRWVRDGIEELLALDASRPRQRGEPLLQAPGAASVVRIATRQLARAGRCRVDVLRVGGRAAAAAIIVESGQQAWLWHIAADVSLVGLSPGTHLGLDVTRTQMERTGLARTEACAGCDEDVRDLWQERTVADYRVAIRPQSSPAALAARMGEALRRRLRSAIAEAYPRPARP